MEKMLARRHACALEPTGAEVPDTAKSPSRSATSRRFVAATRTALAELLAADMSGLDIKVLMIDGCTSATTAWSWRSASARDGTKTPLGLWGATENAARVKSLLADLVERGVSAEDGPLAVVDGGKALTVRYDASSETRSCFEGARFTSAATSATTCRRSLSG